MADILIPFAVQATVKGHTKDGSELLHVFDVKAGSATPSLAQVTAISTTVANWVTGDFAVDLVRTVDHVDELICVSRAEINGPEVVTSINLDGNRAGSIGGLALPNEITIAVKKNTGLSGRPFRGRFFAWPFWSSDLDSAHVNQINSTFAAVLLDVYGSLRADLASSGNPLGVASNVHAVITPVTSLSLSDLIIDAQRRRGPGRGA